MYNADVRIMLMRTRVTGSAELENGGTIHHVSVTRLYDTFMIRRLATVNANGP